MSTVLNYSYCLRTVDIRDRVIFLRGFWDNLEELHRNSLDALETLELDWTALYHACDLCETCLRLGRDGEFLEYLERYDRILREADVDATPGQREVRDEYRDMPALLRLFRDLIVASEAGRIMELTRSVRMACGGKVPWWVRSAWTKRLKGKLSFWRRLWVNVAVL